MQCALPLAHSYNVITKGIMLKCGVVTALIDHHNVFHMSAKANTLCTLLPLHCGAGFCLGLIGEVIF